MKILVTGGSGYIGTTLIPLLLKEGHQVTNVDNLMYQQTVQLDLCRNPNFEMIYGDARDTRIMKEQIKKHDVILPLACFTGVPACNRDPVGATGTNLEAVKMAYDNKSAQQLMIYPCTNSGYGVGQEGIFCDEKTPLNPISLYGKVKVEAEAHLLNGGEAVTFRLATVFGASPRMRLDLLVNDFVFRAVKDRFVVLFEAHFKRNYLHVYDAAQAFMHTIKNYDKMKGQAYNVGLSDANLSKLELCERIKKHVPDFAILVSEIAQDQDKRNYIVSNAKIEATGFRTQMNLDAGIEELIKAYKIIRITQHTNA